MKVDAEKILELAKTFEASANIADMVAETVAARYRLMGDSIRVPDEVYIAETFRTCASKLRQLVEN